MRLYANLIKLRLGVCSFLVYTMNTSYLRAATLLNFEGYCIYFRERQHTLDPDVVR